VSAFDLNRFKTKTYDTTSDGRRIEVGTIKPKAPARKKREPFASPWVQTPAEWIKRLRGQSGAVHDLANYILERDFECWAKISGEIILSTKATGLPSTTRCAAVKVLVDLGLIEAERCGNQAYRVTRLFFLPPRKRKNE